MADRVPRHGTVVHALSGLQHRSCLSLLSILLALWSTGCADPAPSAPVETTHLALAECTVDTDCDEAPPCTTGKCAAGTCRWVRTAPDCCVEDGDCDPHDSCRTGTCSSGGEGEGTCQWKDAPGKPGCCNYISDCDLAPPGYIVQCAQDDQAGYKKCAFVVDPDICQPPVQNLIINEFMANPEAVGDATGEWIELFNPSLDPIYLNGWSLRDDDSDDFQFVSAGPIVVPAGGYFLLARSDNPENNGHITPDFVYYNFTLSNGSDEIVLVNGNNQEVDRVAYGEPDFVPVEGASYELATPYLDNENPIHWRHAQNPRPPALDKGTPGLPNTDAFFFYFTPVVCHDANACTLDTCGDNGEPRCTHEPIQNCCLYDTDCNDGNLCTADSCVPAELACVHDPIPGCCNVANDCPAWSICKDVACYNHQCRYTQRPDKPGCCVVDDDCADINPCTIDFCSQEPGLPYKTCHYNSPGGTQCCLADLECDDGSAATLDVCTNHKCQHPPNPEYCSAPPPQFCDDSDPCTLDGCNLALNLCTHTPVDGCCKEDAACDDGDPCTKDFCQLAVHTCAHALNAGCCHDDADCEPFLTDQDLCRKAICVASQCRLVAQTDANCCLTNADCDDSDPCTDDVCNPGNHTCTHLPKGKSCCATADDCVEDTDPCTRTVCAANECLNQPIPGCCKGDWQCNDDNLCTLDKCVNYACRYAVEPGSGCCLDAQDCPATCSPCIAVSCAPGHYCRQEPVADCTRFPDFAEGFTCDLPLADLGWTTSPAALGTFTGGPGHGTLGTDRAARLAVDAAVTGGTSCLTSPWIAVNHPEEPLSLTFRQQVDSAPEGLATGSFSVRVRPKDVAASVQLGAFAAASVTAESPYMLEVPAKVKSAPFRLAFCADIPQGSAVTTWLIDSIRVGRGRPPRFQGDLQDLWMLPGETHAFTLAAADDDGDPLTFYLTGPGAAVITDIELLAPGEASCSVLLAPGIAKDVGAHTVSLEVTDGFFMDRRAFTQTVYLPKCETAADCDDENFCTIDACDPITGCLHETVAGCCNELTPCDDADACTQDTCVEAACVFAPVTCDDDNPCTDDTCDPAVGCQFPNNTLPCDDGSVCTWHDTCFKGQCVGLDLSCNDELACTKDTCDPKAGCQHKSLCSDSVLCTTDVCTPLGCKSGKVPVGTPMVDGLIDAEWPDSTIQWAGQGNLGDLRMLLDEFNLYVATQFAPVPYGGGVLFIDADFGKATGFADLSTIDPGDTGLEAILDPPLAVSFPGFGADLAVAFAWGEDPALGASVAGCYLLTAGEPAQDVPCLVAFNPNGMMEAIVPWYLLFDDGQPLDDRVSAAVLAALDGEGTVVDTVPPAPGGVINDVSLFGIPDPMCLVSFCGDGVVDVGEECDDGPDNSDLLPDACRSNCKNPWCGDGIQDAGEACDMGNENSDSQPDACRTDCTAAHCGDGIVDTGETCDDGNDVDGGDQCPNDCQPYDPVCGNGWTDPDEECDLGDENSDTLPDTCRTDCKNPSCGDGITDTGEECDDGNDVLGDGCAPDCTIESYVPDPGDIIFTEIMQNPAKVYDTLGEYVEIYNTRDFDINIGGWELHGGQGESHTLGVPGALTVPAKGFLVLGVEDDPGLNGGVTVHYQYADVLLGNGADTLILSYKGAVSDEVHYDGGPAFPDPKGAAMNLSPTAFSYLLNDNGANWCQATSPLPSGDKGTPGQPNDACN